MPISFPTSLDNLTNPVGTDGVAVVDHASQHANVNDAVEALEAKVGADSSAVQTSHDYKLSTVTGANKAETQANKETSALDTSTTKYPCNNVVKTAVDAKALDSEVVKYNTLKRNGDVFVAQGDENDGTVSGGVTISGGAMVFDGTDGYVYGDAFEINRTNPKNSFSFWIKIEEDGDGCIFVNKKNDDDVNFAFGWRNSANRIEGAFYTVGTPNVYRGRFATPVLNKSQWYHIAIVYDGTTLNEGTNGVDVWVDGVKQSRVSANFGSAGNIGRWALGSTTHGYNYFKGDINFSIFLNYSLTQEEITEIYNAGKDAQSPIQNGLVGQWSGRDFEGTEATPTKILDTAVSIVRLPRGTDGYVLTADSGEATGLKWNTPLADPTFTGTVTLPTTQLGESSIKLDPVLSADEKWSGITTSGTAGATLAVGDVCYLASSGKWLLNDGILDGTDTGFSKQLGICVLASTDTNPTEILLYGKVRSAAFPAFTVGSPVYLDDTAGDLTVTQPSTTNFCIRIVGYALTAEDLLFNPSNDYIIHT